MRVPAGRSGSMSTGNKIRQELIRKSEELVDLIEEFEEGIRKNDERACREATHQLDRIGFYLTDRIPGLSGNDLAYAQYMMGSLCSVLRMWPQAEEAYSKALETWPDHVGLLNEYFICLMELEKYEEALPIIRRSIGHGGAVPEVLQNHAAVLVHLGRVDEARMVLINSCARFPNDRETREMLAELDRMTA